MSQSGYSSPSPRALSSRRSAAELVARGVDPRRTAYYVYPPGLRLRLHPHPEAFPQLEPSVRFEINGVGERGDELPRLAGGGDALPGARGRRQPAGRILAGSGHGLAGGPAPSSAAAGATEGAGGLEGARGQHRAVGNRLGIARPDPGPRPAPLSPRLQAIVILVGASDVLRWLEAGCPARRARPGDRSSELFRCHPEQARSAGRRGRLAMVEVAAAGSAGAG